MDNRDGNGRQTRRAFLRSALSGAAAAGLAVPVSGKPRLSYPERERLETLAARYGSELGEIHRVGGES